MVVVYMTKYYGEVVTIKSAYKGFYRIKEDGGQYCWIDEMIEGLVRRIGEGTCSFAEGQESHTKSSSELYKEHIENMNKETNKIIANAGAGDMLAEKTMLDCILAKGLLIPNGYEIKDENGNVINATKIVLEKKKKEYPKTFLECCDVLNIGNLIERGVKGYKAELFDTLQKLYICRDAYWKLYGEEMGLDKPWEPNDADYITGRYCIFVHQGNIICSTPAEDCPFAFPAEEMRDAFYENFKEEIEICKELL